MHTASYLHCNLQVIGKRTEKRIFTQVAGKIGV